VNIENLSFENYNYNYEFTTNSSVKTLTLTSCVASEWTLPKIARRFASLDTLKLDNHSFHVCDIDDDCPFRMFTVNASCLDLKKFYIHERKHHEKYSEVYVGGSLVFVCVERDGLENRYFVSSNFDKKWHKTYALNGCSQDQFNTHQKLKNKLVFYLKFKSVKTVVVEAFSVEHKVSF
jgi:hypothetical protein